jgi:hypothetical protein
VIYLTRQDVGSAVYRSQVIGTCQYLHDDLQWPIRLVALASPRHLLTSRRWLRAEFEPSTVVPLYPKAKRWHQHLFLLAWYLRLRKASAAIARGVEATNLALALRDQGLLRKVCYDGRGAIAAEKAEYRHPSNERRIQSKMEMEREAVLRSDFRLSVSNELVGYWRDEYGYAGNRHVVVPCTLKEWEGNSAPDPDQRRMIRDSLDFGTTDVVLVYAGSLSGWQSLDGLAGTLRHWLTDRVDLKVLFLAREHPAIAGLEGDFPTRILRRFVDPEEVHPLLAAADYGLLLREPSITNAVAAPTKFAEYLAAGLGVLISPGIGDYSGFVRDNGCGEVVDTAEFDVASLHGRSDEERQECIQLARRHFLRSSFRKEYERVFASLSSA